jgi:hypothetical protein
VGAVYGLSLCWSAPRAAVMSVFLVLSVVLAKMDFWNGTIDTMFVRKGNLGFTITSTTLGAKTPTDPDAPKAAMVALATTALPNL